MKDSAVGRNVSTIVNIEQARLSRNCLLSGLIKHRGLGVGQRELKVKGRSWEGGSWSKHEDWGSNLHHVKKLELVGPTCLNPQCCWETEAGDELRTLP